MWSEKLYKTLNSVFQQAGKTSPSQEEAEITTANVLAGGHIKQVLFSGQCQQVWKHIVYVWKQQLIGEMFKTQVASTYAQHLWKNCHSDYLYYMFANYQVSVNIDCSLGKKQMAQISS